MKHARRQPNPEDYPTMDPEEPMEEGSMVCDLCGESGNGLITLQNENGFVICSDCIDGLTNILAQVRQDLSESGDLFEHRSLN